MPICLVLHAEGPGDAGHPAKYLAPKDPLLEDDIGPAHELVRRILDYEKDIPPKAVDFREPLRTRTGKPLRGSQLLKPEYLDDVLAGWMLDSVLVVFLVDSDGESPSDRAKVIRDALFRNNQVGVVGVAVKEFESWLISDQGALRTVIGGSCASPANVEELDRRTAKNMLRDWAESAARPKRGPLEIRRELAATLDLDVVSARCPSFAAFRKELSTVNL